MNSFLLTEAADADLDEIWAFVAGSTSPEAADRLEDALYQSFRKLARTPQIGHARADLAPDRVAFYTVHSIMIAYLPATRPLQVIRVLHGARDIRPLLEE